MASSTARFAVASFAPDIEPDRSRTMARLTGGRPTLAVAAGREKLTEVSDIRVVILRLSHVTTLDATGAAVLADTIRSLERRDVAVLVSGLPNRFVGALTATGVYAQLVERGHVFDHTPEAIEHARRHVTRDRHHEIGEQA